MSDRLENCPWCDAKPQLITSPNHCNWVRCVNTECQAEGPTAETEEEAAEKWNSGIRRMRGDKPNAIL